MNGIIKPVRLTVSLQGEAEQHDDTLVVLLVRHRGERHLTVHDDKAAALAAMMRFVDARWVETALSREMADPDHERLIKAWCSATGSFYMIGSPEIHLGD